MDRRKFLWSGAATGAVGALASGFTIGKFESGAHTGRPQGSATITANTSGASTVRPTGAGSDGLLLGYLPGSATMLASAESELRIWESARGLRWSRSDHVAPQSSIGSSLQRSTTVNLSIGALQLSSLLIGTLQSLEIVAHFAIDAAPYFAPFAAWRYRAGTAASKEERTQALTFTAEMPDRVALEVTYSLNPRAIAGGTRGAGSLYLPIGRIGASGLAPGLFVLAAASPDTGVAPDLSACIFSGMQAPLMDSSGRPPNFDYVMLAIRPVTT